MCVDNIWSDFLISKLDESIERYGGILTLAGLPEAGKTTLIRQFFSSDEDVTLPKESTGICENIIVVDLDKNIETTGAFTNDDKWISVENFGESIVKSMGPDNEENFGLTQDESQAALTEPTSIAADTDGGHFSQYTVDDIPTTTSLPSSRKTLGPASNQQSNSLVQPAMNKLVKKNVKNLVRDFKIESLVDLASKSSLFIRDVGGQLEFKEALPLLNHGASIFVFVFDGCVSIELNHRIFYRYKEKGKFRLINNYCSQTSTKEAFLQFLNSVQSIKHTKQNKSKKMKPHVFAVATHLDIFQKVESTECKKKIIEIKTKLIEISHDISNRTVKISDELKENMTERDFDDVMEMLSNTVLTISNNKIEQCNLSDLKEKIVTKEYKEELDDINEFICQEVNKVLRIDKLNVFDTKAFQIMQYFCKYFMPFKEDKTRKNFSGLLNFKSRARPINEMEETLCEWKGDIKIEVLGVNYEKDGIGTLKKNISRIIKGNSEFRFPLKIKEALFSFHLLKQANKCVITLADCESLAKDLCINDISGLLTKLHSQVGIIQWHNVDKLKKWIFTDPTYLFKTISKIIIQTFEEHPIDRKSNKKDPEQFGLFTKEKLTEWLPPIILRQGCDLIEFFIHLGLMARVKAFNDDSEKYFIPCVIQQVSSIDTSPECDDSKNNIPILYYTFQCDCTPIGLFGHLIAGLLGHKHKRVEIYLDQDNISKTGIVLNIKWNLRTRRHCQYDTDIILEDHVFIRNCGSHLEIKLMPEDFKTSTDHRKTIHFNRNSDSPLEINFMPKDSKTSTDHRKTICTLFRMLLEYIMSESLHTLNYNWSKVQPTSCFRSSSGRLCGILNFYEQSLSSTFEREKDIWFSKGMYLKY